MTQEEEKALEILAARQMEAHPRDRVIPFWHEGKKYWIKKKQGNGRNRWAKAPESAQFYYEAAHIMMAARLVPHVPEMVLFTEDCMVLRDSGYTVGEILFSKGPEEEKKRILRAAGAALCAIHEAGLAHGRPALRDMTWNGKKIVFLDWENRPFFKDLRRRQSADVILFFHSMYREPWMHESWARAAWEGYAAAGGTDMLEEACRFLAAHAFLEKICAVLHPFRFKDLEALLHVYRWLPRQSASASAPSCSAGEDVVNDRAGQGASGV